MHTNIVGSKPTRYETDTIYCHLSLSDISWRQLMDSTGARGIWRHVIWNEISSRRSLTLVSATHSTLQKATPEKWSKNTVRVTSCSVFTSKLPHWHEICADFLLLQNFSGSVYGLRLTLNVEQYEYMKGPNDDAGVKVWCDVIESQIDTTCLRSGNSSWAGERTKLKIILLWMQIMLHEPEEFPLMADNGFAVEPGTHTLITVRNSEVCHRATQI